jgi:hypothetical protein
VNGRSPARPAPTRCDATAVQELLRDDGFRLAFVVATVGALVAWWLIRRGSSVVGPALVAVVAALIALHRDYHLDAHLVVGLALLALAWLTRELGRWWSVLLMVSGALLVIADLEGLPGWMQVVGFVAIVVAVPLATHLDRVLPRCMPLLVLVSVAGIYACAPDTEISKVMLGALVPVALLGFVRGVQPCAATASLVGLVVWTAVLEGRGRPGAVVGSIACLGVVLLAPLVRWRRSALRPTLLVLATQVALVLFVSRVAGLRDSAWIALALCVPAFVIASLLLVLASRASDA